MVPAPFVAAQVGNAVVALGKLGLTADHCNETIARRLRSGPKQESMLVIIFYILAVLLLLQGIASLVEGIKFLSFVRRSDEGATDFHPRLSIIAPCKGIDPGLAENLAALFGQDYPDYEIIFTVASGDDPARPVIDQALARHPRRRAQVVIAGKDRSRGEKVNNLLAGLNSIDPNSRVLVFVDSDARVRPDWLRSLVAPLRDEKTGAATGYRWYLPSRGGFWSGVLSAWNGSIATTLGEGGRNFAWGGSTAIRIETFERIGVRARWAHAVSDDYALTRAVREAGLHIRFVPRCLLISREDAPFGSLLEFTTRQIIITRVYNQRLWWVGIISQALFCSVFFSGLIFALLQLAQGHVYGLMLALLGAIYMLGSAKGALRLKAAREMLPFAAAQITRLWPSYVVFWPLVSLLFLFNFVKSASTRTIEWRGVRYQMLSPEKTVVR